MPSRKPFFPPTLIVWSVDTFVGVFFLSLIAMALLVTTLGNLLILARMTSAKWFYVLGFESNIYWYSDTN